MRILRLNQIPWAGRHKTNGFPDIPAGQLHIGIWLTTSQRASWPHVPGHGSVHLFLIQALSRGQSSFITHSGLHPLYGSPWYSGKQVQTPSLHCAFGPHGDGLHGSIFTGGGGAEKENYPNYFTITIKI